MSNSSSAKCGRLVLQYCLHPEGGSVRLGVEDGVRARDPHLPGQNMFMAYVILTFSLGLLFFYLQATCQRILRREFDQEYFLSVVHINRLGFAQIREAVEQLDAPAEYSRYRLALKCDFMALSYLLENAANPRHKLAGGERLLRLYFRLLMFSFFVRHVLGLGEKPAILKLTAVLRYFANVVGQRVSLVRFGNLNASEYLAGL